MRIRGAPWRPLHPVEHTNIGRAKRIFRSAREWTFILENSMSYPGVCIVKRCIGTVVQISRDSDNFIDKASPWSTVVLIYVETTREILSSVWQR